MITTAGQSLLATFDRVRIINLQARADRRREIRQEFSRFGLEIEDAGNTGKIAFHEACRPDDPGEFPSIGARGCFLSHLQVLEAALNDGVGSILILEDDLDFSNDAEARMPHVFGDLAKRHWGIFYGGYHAYSGPADLESALLLIDPDKGLRTTHFLAFSRQAISLAVPYLTTMAARPSGSPDGGPMHVDGAYSWLRKAYPQIETWLVSPELGHQRPSRTDIHELGLVDRTPVLRSLAGVARRLKRLARK